MATLAEVFHLALQNHQAGNLAFAEQLYRQILAADATHADTHHLLGVLAYQTGRHEQAVQSITHALSLKPSEATFHFNLGAAEAALGQLPQAVATYRLALQLKPDFPEVHNNLGNALDRQGLFDEAVIHLREALRTRPGYAEAHLNLSSVLLKLGKLDEVVMHSRAALAMRPDYVEAHNNLACALHRLGHFDDAMSHYNLALHYRSDYGESRWNRSLLLLLLGEFARGWPEYEWRWTRPNFSPHQFAGPPWDGSPLDGRTILVYAEQGLGDTLQFIRYAALVTERGGRVVFECQPPLLRLLSSVRGIDHLLANGTPLPAFDVHIPLLSLPGIFQTRLDTIPQTVPYLEPEAQLVSHWRRELAPVKGLKIGIAWQGNSSNLHDRTRSIPLACFANLAALAGIQLISLQHGPGTEQLQAVAGQWPILDLTNRLGDGCESLANLAALMKSLDLVISCDTAIAHLAGAMGLAVWVALPLVSDWRWLVGRDTSPWYPTMRLFRQTRAGDWDELLERMAQDLNRHRRKPPIDDDVLPRHK